MTAVEVGREGVWPREAQAVGALVAEPYGRIASSGMVGLPGAGTSAGPDEWIPVEVVLVLDPPPVAGEVRNNHPCRERTPRRAEVLEPAGQ